MPVYLAKFPDGTTQLASAKNKHDLMHLLDEVGSPTVAQITSLKDMEWMIEAVPSGAVYEEGIGTLLSFSLSVAACDAGFALVEALSEAYPCTNSVGSHSWDFEQAAERDKGAPIAGWSIGTVPKSLPLVTDEDFPF